MKTTSTNLLRMGEVHGLENKKIQIEEPTLEEKKTVKNDEEESADVVLEPDQKKVVIICLDIIEQMPDERFFNNKEL
jgi:hypothetical protein